MAQTFEQSLQETGQQGVLDQLRQTFKFGEAKEAYERGGDLSQFGIGGFGGGAGGGDFGSALQRALDISRQAVDPAVSSFRDAIPETREAFSQERSRLEERRSPLRQRYDNLIADIRGQQGEAEQSQTRITGSELGKRGIVGSSTMAQQELENVVQNIRGQANRAVKDVSLQGLDAEQNLDSLISGLATQETGAVRNILNAIGQLQAGVVPGAVNAALTQLQLGQNQRQFDTGQSFAQKQFDEQIRQFNEGGGATSLNPLQQAQANYYNAQAGALNNATPQVSLADLFASL